MKDFKYSNRRFGKIVITERVDKVKVIVKCDCGVTKQLYMGNILTSHRKGSVVSCGCMRGYNISQKLTGKESHKKIYFTDEQVKNIMNQFHNRVSLHTIANQYGLSQPVIRNVVKDMGFLPQQRRSDLNENYFDVVDSETKAYWLGYLAADGTIRVREQVDRSGKRKTRGNSIHLKLSTMDEEHLKKFRDEVCPNSVMKYATSIVKTKKGNISTSYTVILNLHSNHIVNQIVDKGVGPRKTFTIGKPNIEEKYIKHYIRGLFDGDGCVSIQDGKRLNYKITTASENMNTFLSELFESLGINMIRMGINCVIGRKEDTMKFYNYLYDDATIWLERKKDKTISVLEEIKRIEEWELKYCMKYRVDNTWSDENLDILISSYNEGKKYKEIERDLNGHFNPTQISSKVYKMVKKNILNKR
jgi:ribosomal protein S25